MEVAPVEATVAPKHLAEVARVEAKAAPGSLAEAGPKLEAAEAAYFVLSALDLRNENILVMLTTTTVFRLNYLH